MTKVASCCAIMSLCRCQSARSEVNDAGGVAALLRLIRTHHIGIAAPAGGDPDLLGKAAASALFWVISSRVALGQLVNIGGVDVLSEAAMNCPASRYRNVLVKVLRKVAYHSSEARNQLATRATAKVS